MKKNKKQQIHNHNVKNKTSFPAKKNVGTLVWIIAFAIALITFIVFSPSLKCGFTNFDDDKYITQNPLVVNNSIDLKKIFTTVVTKNDYYPITMISFACNYQIGKLNPFGYHLFNLLLHIFNTLLVFMLIYIITKRNLIMASIVSLFFGIHPMHVESVTWLTERKDVLFMFFFLIGMITYLRFRETRKMLWYFITIILFILSCLSKGTAVSFPAVLLLLDYLLENKLNKKMFIEKIPFFLIGITFLFITYWLHITGTMRFDVDNRTIIQKVMYASYDALWYIVKFIVPANLSVFYTSPKLNELPFLFYLAPFIFMCILVIVYLYLRKEKAIIFGLLFYFVSVVMMLQFVYSGGNAFIVADRYNYLPSVGLIFVIAYLINKTLQKRNNYKYTVIGLTAIYIVVFSCQTYARTKVWQTSETLWNDAINKDPEGCFYGYTNRGIYYQFEKNDYSNAMHDYNKALAINPNHTPAYNNRGLIYYYQGKQELALNDFNRAIELNPNSEIAYCNRGLVYEKKGQQDLAMEEYNRIIKLYPKYYLGYYNRGSLYLNNKQFELALEDFKKTTALNPSYSYAYGNKGAIYMYRKHNDSAIVEFTKAIEFNGLIAGYWFNRSAAEKILGKRKEAISDVLKAQQLGIRIDINYLKELGIH